MRFLLLLLVECSIAWAQRTNPTTVSDQQFDLSSPKSAAVSLYRAVDRGDGEAIRQIFFTANDTERRLADAYADMLVSAKRLADVAKKKFGGAADAFAQGAVPSEDIERIEAAEVTMQGEDRATLQLPRSPRPMSFRRGERGDWQLVITDFAGAQPDQIDNQIALTREIATVMSDIADEIDADKYATAQDAEQAIQQRMSEVLTRAVRTGTPSTRPATQPKE